MDNQLDDVRSRALRRRLGELIDRYDPDVFGLNEVVAEQGTGASRVLAYLEMRGYETHFTYHSPDRWNTVMGSAIATKRRPLAVREPSLGPDTSAALRGTPGHEVRAIDADMPVGSRGGTVRVVVNYWAHLVPYNWPTHQAHARAFRELVTAGPARRTIIGGDFNELKHMPAIRDLARTYHRATGTWLRPTWRWNGRDRLLVRANYDHLLWSRHDDLALREFAVLPAAPSDHAPLLGRFLV